MENFFKIINDKKPVLVDFFATWCGPCQMLAPILTDVKHSLGERITIIKVDVDKNPELMSNPRFLVKGVPTLMLFQEGKMLWRQSGVLSKDQLISTILDHIE
ncbi:thioredoxin [Flavobacterium sp.]|uniref:thioredoxin n=1 Tax=Flavobacterium sp. TaxID=239 RepID=UPI002606B8DD|nr:thioredoxin [Flavobacterium sp.]